MNSLGALFLSHWDALLVALVALIMVVIWRATEKAEGKVIWSFTGLVPVYEDGQVFMQRCSVEVPATLDFRAASELMRRIGNLTGSTFYFIPERVP